MINNINFNKNNPFHQKNIEKMEGKYKLSLKEGQMIKGKVIELDNHTVKILMEDGQIISGDLVEKEGLVLDIMTTFYVEKSVKNLLILKLIDKESPILESNISKNEIIKNILEKNKLLINDLNSQIVEELLNQHMPLDKKTILYFIREFHNNNVPISTLITMKKYEIPITKDNVMHFEKLFHESNSFNNQFQRLIDTFINDDIGDTSLQLGHVFKQNILPMNFLSSDELPLTKLLSKEDSFEFLKDFLHLISKSLESDFLTDHLDKEINRNLPFNQDKQVTGTGITKYLQKMKSDYLLSSEDIMVNKVLNDIKSIIEIYQKTSDKVITKDHPFHLSSNKLETSLSASHSNNMDDLLIEFFQSKGYKNLLRELFTNKCYPTIDKIKDRQGLLESIKNIEEELTDLKEEIEKIKDTSSKVQNQNTNRELTPYTITQNQISNKIDFMANLYKHVPFLQVPIQILQNKGKGDLYVFTNKKRGNNLPLEDLKVLLRLDMKHLGRINAKIRLKNKNVYTRFYTENDLSYEILSSHVNLLEKLLEEKGFHTKTKVLKSDKMNLEVASLLKSDNHSSKITTYTFDTKI